jgi:ADP-heptose:LPS heptosyltransferase
VKPKLLIIELWGVGDLAIATPFLRKACEHFEVTLLAKAFARDLQPRFWPAVKVVPFHAPWTAFNRKYHLLSWPWRSMFSVWNSLYRERFDVALSARWDPRDHFLLKLTGARARLGFPRTGSQIFLTHPLASPDHNAHRYENWRVIAQALNLKLERRDKIPFPATRDRRLILVHTGAAQPVRVWPLEHYRCIAEKLRARGHTVRILCNPEQEAWWKDAGESQVAAPRTISELLRLMDDAGVFIGNDSGPGHLAAFCGIPTFTFFGPQVAEWFVPLHPAAEFMEGKACPFKPCSDYCRFPAPHCLWNITEAEAWPRVEQFMERHLGLSVPDSTRTAAAVT